jgi:hypothetical protein
MSSDGFWEHYWDTVRWKEVAREARTPEREGRTDQPTISSSHVGGYGSSPGLFKLAYRCLGSLFLLPFTVIGCWVTVNVFFGGIWATAASILCLLVSFFALCRWISYPDD